MAERPARNPAAWAGAINCKSLTNYFAVRKRLSTSPASKHFNLHSTAACKFRQSPLSARENESSPPSAAVHKIRTPYGHSVFGEKFREEETLRISMDTG